MREPKKVRLTAERIRQIEPPKSGEGTVWDTDVIGFGVRCLPSGAKTFIATYRTLAGKSRRYTIGKVEGLRVDDARAFALDLRARAIKGEDPALDRSEQRKQKARPALTLAEALDRYDRDQERRKVVGRAQVMSSLRRQLLDHVKDQPLAQLDRRAVVEAVETLEAAGMAGAARALRSHASTFLKWCADRGLMEANPLQGYRAARSTRAQRVAQPGRDLSDTELAWAWHAAGGPKVSPAFGALVRMLILTGQRRTETSHMRWSDLSEDGKLWRIPASETKNGVAHEVPLPPLARSIIAGLTRYKTCDFVFSTKGAVAISGWSKLEKNLRAQLEADAARRAAEGDGAGILVPWTLHDLRRTFRSGLTRLGVEPDVAEIMLNHRPETLKAVYDRDPRLAERTAAAERWALHVAAVVDPDGRSNVVKLRGAV